VYDLLGGDLPVPTRETALIERAMGVPLASLRPGLVGSAYLYKAGADPAERQSRERQSRSGHPSRLLKFPARAPARAGTGPTTRAHRIGAGIVHQAADGGL
jgi:hypothetical protein